MTENVKKIFEMLNLKPHEDFKCNSTGVVFRFTDYLTLKAKKPHSDKWENVEEIDVLKGILNGDLPIILLSKTKKVKLRDLTAEQLKKWRFFNGCTCIGMANCSTCIFCSVYCDPVDEDCWIHHKELYSDKFLDQEIEVKE